MPPDRNPKSYKQPKLSFVPRPRPAAPPAPVSSALPSSTLDLLRQRLLTRVRQAFEAGDIDPAGLDSSSIDFLICRATTEEHIGTILEICDDGQLSIPDELLACALGLREWSKGEKLDQGVSVSYLRSFKILVDTLIRLILHWHSIGFAPPQALFWLKYLTARKLHGDEYLYLRYPGQCKGPLTPDERLKRDMDRTSGLYGQLMHWLETHAPGVLDDAKVYVPIHGRLPPTAGQPERDLQERSWIAFLGVDSIVNQQLGGIEPSYLPRIELRTLFSSHGTSLFSRLLDLRSAFPADDASLETIKAKLPVIFDGYKFLAEHYGKETGTDRCGYSSATAAMEIAQATPEFLFLGGTPLLCVGDDIPMQSYVNAQSFFSGFSRSGQLTNILLQQIAQAEEETHKSLNLASLIPFVDLFPLPGTGCLDEHIDLVHQICEVHCPWVTVTLGQVATTVVTSNFHDKYGLPINSELSLVGVPVLVSFADHIWMEEEGRFEPPDDSYTICIQHVHPGRDNYNAQPQCQRELLYITWGVTAQCMELVFTRVPVLMKAGATRRKALETVIVEFNERTSRSGLKERFDATKKRLSEERKTQALSDKATERCLRNGLAMGAIGSPDRIAQTEFMWKRHYHNLHLDIPHTAERRLDWLDWGQTAVQEGASYYMTLLHQMGIGRAGDHLRHVLISVAPPDAVDDSWMQDPAQRAAALKRKSAQMHQGHSPDHFSSARQSMRRRAQITRDPIHAPRFAFLETLHGREVKVEVDGMVRIFWKRAKDENLTVCFRVSKGFHTRSEADNCVLNFNAAGIDLVRKDGSRLGLDDDAIFPYSSFCMHKEASLFRELWIAELTLLDIPVPAEARATPLSDTYGPAGQPPAGHARKKPFGAVTKGDSQWLLRKFLDDQFPEGSGRTEYATTQHDIDVYRSIWPMWTNFLENYTDHPHYKTWNEVYELDWSKAVGTLAANIKFFRHLEVTERKTRTGLGNRKCTWYKTWRIGPPGSGRG